MEEKTKMFLLENPHYLGLFFALLGVGGLICAIMDVNWLFGDVNTTTYNLSKIDGWVNFFGRNPARIIFGVFSLVVIIAGLSWFCLASKK
jgi:hypothetical protein